MPTILLVEDDPAVSKVLGQYLEDSGFEVIAAEGTSRAQAELDRNRTIDLMLVDLVMPANEPDGLVFAQSAKSKIPDVPVIFLTGYYGFVAKSGQMPGPVLYKPVNFDVLDRAIAMLLERPSSDKLVE